MAEHRHKRDTDARRMPRAVLVAAPLAVLATASAVTLGVAAAEPEIPNLIAQGSAADLGAAVTRDDVLSRSAPRVAVTPLQQELRQRVERRAARAARAERAATTRAVANAEQRLWTTTALDLWSDETPQADKLGEIDAGKRVLVTGRKAADRVEIVVDGESRWVSAGYLSEEEPLTLGGTCANGTSVPSGVAEGIKKVHAAVCANFPEITTYGTIRSSDGSSWREVDIMVSGERGWQVANFVRENAAALGVEYVIYSRNIWSVQRGSEGWRGMEDRGSVTQNHYDHVHVTAYA
ncbi:hypothetical protein GCM10027062_43360 [Nocardioides hungaricus]